LRAYDERALMWWLGIGVAAILLVLQEAAITGSDGQTVYEVTKSLVDRGDISLDPDFVETRNIGAVPGVGDESYSKYPIGLSLLGVVPYLLALPVSAVVGHKELVQEAAVASLVPIACAGLVVAVYALARQLGGSVRSSLIVGVGAVAGTYLLPYSAEFFSEPFMALGLVVSIERALARRRAQSALALGLAVLFRPQALLFAPILVLFLIHRHGWRSLRASIPPLAGAVAVTLTWNYARFHDLAESGYGKTNEGFTSPVLEGIEMVLFTADKSLFLFAPIVLLVVLAYPRLWREHRWAAVLIGANFVIAFALAVTWHDLRAGWCWGPRLLLPALPAAVAVLAPWLDRSLARRWLVVGVFAIGFAISLPGTVISTRAQQLEGEPNPGIVRQAELVPDRTRYSLSHLGTGAASDHRRYLDSWQIGVGRELGTKGLVAAILPSALLAAVAVLAGLAVRRGVLMPATRE
jgi:hypothetical protein